MNPWFVLIRWKLYILDSFSHFEVLGWGWFGRNLVGAAPGSNLRVSTSDITELSKCIEHTL